MGKVVDSIAATLSVQNNNNSSNCDKLKLFRNADGTSVCGDMSVPLKTLLDSEELFNGDNIILEYVANDVESIETK